MTLIGRTIDDAVGEAYDKAATILQLGYPGGPRLDALAQQGDDRAHDLPISSLGRESLDFSFSGMKTAVVNFVRRHPEVSDADVAAGFQEAVVDVLVTKTIRAGRRVGAKTLCLGGGVAANSRPGSSVRRQRAVTAIPGTSCAPWRTYRSPWVPAPITPTRKLMAGPFLAAAVRRAHRRDAVAGQDPLPDRILA